MKTFIRLFGYLQPVAKPAIIFIFCSICASIFGVINLSLFIPLLDVLFGNVDITKIPAKPAFSFTMDFVKKNFDYYMLTTFSQYGKVGPLYFVASIVMVSVILSNIFRYATTCLMEFLKMRIVSRLRKEVFEKTTNLHVGYFSTQRKGDIISRIMGDIFNIESTIMSSFRAVFKDSITLVISFVILYHISPELSLFSLIFIPISGGFVALLVGKLRSNSSQGQNSLGKLNSILDEMLGGLKIVKGFNATAYINKKFSDENDFYTNITKKIAYRRELSSPFSEVMGVMIITGIVIYGGLLILQGESNLKAAEFFGFVAMFSQITQPIKEITNAFGQTQISLVSAERVFSLIDTKPLINSPKDAHKIVEFQKEIAFNDVFFHYNESEEVLKGISFKIPKGKTVALVGTSGGGKSTIADLLPRFYDPTKGNITIDNIDLRSCDIESLRAQLGIVTQEPILFNDTIFNNIAFGISATQEQVVAAAQIANMHEFIMEKPDGYQTNIGDRGTMLSGGQRQRISIARAILRNPPILILDEATSALDNKVEKLVQQALDNLMKDRTSLVIAHRLTTIQNADEIIVLQRGEIVERGTHNELMANENGIYTRLYRSHEEL